MKASTSKPCTDPIPEHLSPFITEQDYRLYSAIDHEAWRYIMRLNQAFFSQHAHEKYLNGLKETGISTERIPQISEMDQCLRRFGWRAVGVSGFIPPAVFMEFQSLGVLPIACDMRTVNHLAYTPAPDIVHEAAGHAPIIADQEYAAYLRAYGEVARKAITSQKDLDVYQCIRRLSEIKENPKASSAEIVAVQKELDQALANVDYVSEATYLSRMNWWTVEYGLVGSMHEPRIYGAGLLSSTGESFHCLSDDVMKIPLTLDCINMNYDITRPQPQLFVTPDFHHLSVVLEEMAATMAFRKGGEEGLAKAKTARTVVTTELDSGIQISGVLQNYLTDKQQRPCYLQFNGPVQLSKRDRQIEGQGADYHPHGFGTAIGKVKIKEHFKNPADLSTKDLETLGFLPGKKSTLEFQSGVKVSGILKNQQPGILTFNDCHVSFEDKILFQPAWGNYDMACGETVVSVFGGAADRVPYLRASGGFGQVPAHHSQPSNSDDRQLVTLYEQVRTLREKKLRSNAGELAEIARNLENNHPTDWLLKMSLLELNTIWNLRTPWADNIRKSLDQEAKNNPALSQLIKRGLEILDHAIH